RVVGRVAAPPGGHPTRHPAGQRRAGLHHRRHPQTRCRHGSGSAAGLSTAPGNPARLVILLSGRGRNLEAIMAAIAAGRLPARIVLVISDQPAARGLRIARQAGLPWAVLESAGYPNRAAYDQALVARIAAARPDWIALAGFMRIL